VTKGPTISGCPFGDSNGHSGINALAFSSSGTLFGINNNEGSGTTTPFTQLVTINTETGGVTDLGSSVNNLDALAFQPSASATPEPTTMLLFGTGLAAIGVGKFRTKRYHGHSSGQ
jgi:PEP-CTERM motif